MNSTFEDRLRELRLSQDPDDVEHYANLVTFVERIKQHDQRLKPGDKAPDFALPTNRNRTLRLGDLLASGPLVLFFVRGLWCPFCNAQIAVMTETSARFAEAGLQIAAVTPETGGRAHLMAERHDAPFTVFCDVDMGVALAYGCVFQVPKAEQEFLSDNGIDLASLSGSGTWFMPVATTFGIDRDGRILRVFGGVDPRDRPSPDDILAQMSRALVDM